MDVIGFVIFLLLVLWIADSVGSSSESSSSGGPNVSLNSIEYPQDIHCEYCDAEIKPTPRTIESDTWDLRCPECGKRGFKHPKREERIQQIEGMLGADLHIED